MSLTIRKIFNNNEKVRSYFFYAVGELVLIVFGIYLALQLDDWKKSNERQSNEVEVLAEILAGFENDIDDLNFNMYLHESAIRSGEIVLNHFENDLPYSDSLSKHFATVLWYSRISIVNGPFDNFKTKGLEIITNDSLRIRITSLYEVTYQTIQKFEQNTFLPDAYILEVHATRFDKTEIYKSLGGTNLGGTNFSAGSMVPHDYNKLKNDRDYIHVVKSSVAKNRFFVDYFLKPSLQELNRLKTDLLKERKRLLVEYN